MGIERILEQLESSSFNQERSIYRKCISRMLRLQIEQVENEAIDWLLYVKTHDVRDALFLLMDMTNELFKEFPPYYHKYKEEQLRIYQHVSETAQTMFHIETELEGDRWD